MAISTVLELATRHPVLLANIVAGMCACAWALGEVLVRAPKGPLSDRLS